MLGWTLILCAASVSLRNEDTTSDTPLNSICQTQTLNLALPGLIILGFSSGVSSPMTSVYITEVDANK